jgi:hypothetical protein
MARNTKKYVEKVAEEVVENLRPWDMRKNQKKPLPATLSKEIILLATICEKAKLEMDYEGIKVIISDYYREEPRLWWESYSVEEAVFKKAWEAARNPQYGIPRYCRQENAEPLLDEYNERICDHDSVHSALIYNHGYKDWMRRYQRVFEFYEKFSKKSPLAGIQWAESLMKKFIPWCDHKELTNRIVSSLNDLFLPNAMITSYAEHFAGEVFKTYTIGHDKGYPIIWRQKNTWSSYDTRIVLENITVSMNDSCFLVDVGKKRFVIDTGEACAKMLTELPWHVQKIWLNSLENLTQGIICVNTFNELAIKRGETYDTKVYALKSDCSPKIYEPNKHLIPSDHDFMNLYITAENNTKKEASNG